MSNRPSRRPSRSAASPTATGTSGGGSSGSTRWIVGGAAAAVVLVLIVALVVSGGPGTSDFEAGTVELSGDPLAVYNPQAGADPTIGTAAPEVIGADAEGSPVSIEADGTPKVVIFLAHWCAHCQAEVPRLQDWIDENGLPEDVDVVAVNTRFQTSVNVWPPDQWLDDEGWTVPTLLDDGDESTANFYGLAGTPYYIVIDADGNVVTRVSGEQTGESFAQLIEVARGGTS